MKPAAHVGVARNGAGSVGLAGRVERIAILAAEGGEQERRSLAPDPLGVMDEPADRFRFVLVLVGRVTQRHVEPRDVPVLDQLVDL